MDLTKLDIEILKLLCDHDMKSAVNSYRVMDIVDNLDPPPTYFTIARHIKDKLLPNSLIEVGMRDSRSNTYYITTAGIDYLNKIFPGGN